MAEKYKEARARATKKYKETHKERVKYLNRRSAARTFVEKYGTTEDLKKIRDLIDKRLKQED